MLVFDKECFLIIGVGKGKEVLRDKKITYRTSPR